MTTFNFLVLIAQFPWTFSIALVLGLLIFIPLSNRLASSWFNPVKFNVLTAGIGFGVVLFLKYTNQITTEDFIYFLTSSIIFWSIFCFIYGNRFRRLDIKLIDETYILKPLFVTTYVIYILLTLLVYVKLGIPIFNEDSRLSTFTGSGGFGIIDRITPILRTFVIFYLVSKLFQTKSTISVVQLILLLIPIIAIGILSGSRSSFLIVVFVFWGYKTFYKDSEPKLINYKKMLIPFLALSVASFSIQSEGNFAYAMFSFVQRIVACGDLYWYAFPDQTWKSVVIHNPFLHIMVNLLAPFRLMDISFSEIPIGFQFTNIVYPGIEGRAVGPVALFSVSGLIYFGYIGGLIFTAFQSVLCSLAFRLFALKSNSFIICFIAFYGFLCSVPLIGDIAGALSSVADFIFSIITFTFILLLTRILFGVKGINRTQVA